MKSPALTLHKELVRILERVDVPNGPLRVIDYHDERPDPPYIVITRHIMKPWHSAVFDGHKHDIRLSLRTGGSQRTSVATATYVIEAIHKAEKDFKLDGHVLRDMRMESCDAAPWAQAETNKNYSIELVFEALTLSEE